MKCHAGVEFESGKPCPKCSAKLGDVCWPGINADLTELPRVRERLRQAEWVLEASGFRRCDIPACNCNSWHQVGGFAERFREILEAVEDAGYSTNGKILLEVIKEILAASSRLPSHERSGEI